ncbi:MAG: rhodanese-related sulfurtransferase [Bacteroidia bacterium]|jgi:rhodanese-related sulfurtransferase
MKIITRISTVIILAVFMVSCSTGQNKTAEGTIAENVNVEGFVSQIEGAQLLDVRTPDEWNEGIIEGATMSNFYDEGFETSLSTLDKEKPVAVYCKSGGRSGKAMSIMNKLGFKEVYNLDGGIGAWNKASKPTVKP